MHGIEPICRVLSIARSTYHAHVAKRVERTRRSARARRDDALRPQVRRVFEENFRVYGVRKIWRQQRRAGVQPRPLKVARLIRAMGLRATVPRMRRCGGGSIVNISSIGGFVGSANAIGYCDAKFAIRGMSKVAAIELGQDNIRVNTVHPGAIATPLLMTHPDFARYERDAMATPLGRIGEPEEISRLVVFLASDEASFSTGAEFIADGGQLVQ